MLDAPPNRKAMFPATAKAWPCLWQKTWTIRWGLSIYQWATTKQINISSSFILTSLHLKIWMSLRHHVAQDYPAEGMNQQS